MSWLGLNSFIGVVPLGALLFHLSPTAVSLLDNRVELRSLNQRWLQEKSFFLFFSFHMNLECVVGFLLLPPQPVSLVIRFD